MRPTVGVRELFARFCQNFPSVNTRDAYFKDLWDFYNFVQIAEPSQWTAQHFNDYRDALSKNKSPKTVNRKISTLKSFVEFCMESGIMSYNPIQFLKLPKPSVISPTLAFTDDEVRRLLAVPRTDTYYGNLHSLMLKLMFFLGLRRSELVQIKLSDIQTSRGHVVVTIRGKGGKSRELPVTPELMKSIQDFCKYYKDASGVELSASDYLLQSNTENKNTIPMDPSAAFRAVRKYAKLIGVDRRVGAHSCRATAISHLLDTQKIPIRDVADFAGHSSINTTTLYDKKRKGLDDSAAYKINY